MSSIDEIKSRIDILDLVSEAGVKLRRSGKNYTGFCPFHDNKHTPAFVVWPETGTWKCFGQCNEGGDIFRFMMKKEGWDFAEAHRRLAERAGVKLESYQRETPEIKEEHDRIRSLLEDSINFYRHQLISTAAGKSALDYLLTKRKLTMQTIETFGLGYSPDTWDAALSHFMLKGYSEQELIDAGLIVVRDNEDGHRKVFDRFRHRIMIPIRDADGKMTGFGARVHPDDTNKEQAKFINSSETPIFSKGKLLYGLDRARKPIRAADQAVIVEGYLDVIALHQAGFQNVISPMGTALTEDQLRLLKRFTRKIVLALDPDAAGQKAVLRGLDAARSALDREVENAFDARGLIHHEARLQADLRVASMTDGLDPDEIVERNPQEWRKLIEHAKPIVAYVIDTLIADHNVNDPKIKSQIAAQVLPLIEDLPDPIERDSYRQMLARRLRVDERTFRGTTVGGVRSTRRRSIQRKEQAQAPVQEKASIPIFSPRHQVEGACLEILLRRPDLLPRVDRTLQESGLSALLPDDFEYTDHQLIVKLVRQSLEQDAADAQKFVEDQIDEFLRETYTSLRAKQTRTELEDKLVSEMLRQIMQMRRETLSESINQLRFLQEEAQSAGDAKALTMYQEMAKQHALSLNYIDQARKKLRG